MKICRDCSSACDNAMNACPRCGSTNLALVAEKHCVYCKTRVVIGTIICPQCHRILPPESDDMQNQNYFTQVEAPQTSSVGLANVNTGAESKNVADGVNIKYVQPITRVENHDIAKDVVASEAENQHAEKAVKSESGISQYDKANPLFAIYDKAPDILPVTKASGVPATTYAENLANEEQLQTDITSISEISEADGYNNTGILQTKEYKTQRLSREEEKPQSKLPRMLIFALGCIYTIIGFCTNYMVHDFGDVLGWEMACSVIIKLRDIFPSVYPYILYGSSFLSKFEVMGSYMPFFMDHAIMFSLFAGVTMMISAVPKWVVSVLHFVVVGCHIGGIYMLSYLFGFGCVGVSAYVFVIGSLAVAVLHLVIVKKVYKFKKI